MLGLRRSLWVGAGIKDRYAGDDVVITERTG